jgi:hypothetical protein
MTGTAKTEEGEFRTIYQLDVVTIPTNRPNIRVDEPDIVFTTVNGKIKAIVDESPGTEREGEGRYVKISESSTGIINAIEFYDVIVCIQSIKDVIKGWNVIFSERFKNYKEIFINDKVLKIGIIGNSNKGKSFILSKLSHIELPFGTNIKTEGLSIKYPDLKNFKNRKIALLDSVGLETPVINIKKNEKGKKESNINIDKEEEDKNGDYFIEKSREKLINK